MPGKKKSDDAVLQKGLATACAQLCTAGLRRDQTGDQLSQPKPGQEKN